MHFASQKNPKIPFLECIYLLLKSQHENYDVENMPNARIMTDDMNVNGNFDFLIK